MANNKECAYRGYGHGWSEEEDEWLRLNIDNYTYPELTALFNKKFGHNLKSVSDHAIKTLGLHKKRNSGCMKKGRKIFVRTVPIGHESVRANGEVYVKVSDKYIPGRTPTISQNPNYRRKKDLIWEKHYGEIPDGCLIVNLDMDKSNTCIKNLYCIPRNIGLMMGKNKWWSDDPNITLAAIKWCELYYKLKEM